MISKPFTTGDLAIVILLTSHLLTMRKGFWKITNAFCNTGSPYAILAPCAALFFKPRQKIKERKQQEQWS